MSVVRSEGLRSRDARSRSRPLGTSVSRDRAALPSGVDTLGSRVAIRRDRVPRGPGGGSAHAIMQQRLHCHRALVDVGHIVALTHAHRRAVSNSGTIMPSIATPTPTTGVSTADARCRAPATKRRCRNRSATAACCASPARTPMTATGCCSRTRPAARAANGLPYA